MSLLKTKKVLVAPLDWGLGHATRCIPIIKELILRNCEVQIASSGDALALLKEELPKLKFHTLSSYQPRYSKSIPFELKIFLQLPKFLKVIRSEHKQVDQIVMDEKIDLIISDNRYGCWNRKVKSIFVTHQVNILLNYPWRLISPLVNFFNHHQIKKFKECWVPDFHNGITGKLSDSKIRHRLIGMLSRFEKMEMPVKYDVLAIISGPEPQRNLFEIQMKEEFVRSGIKYFIVKGNFNEENDKGPNEISHLTSDQLNELIASSSIVICRSGYSSIMDLWKLGKRAIFVPTPGQTEQEYLATEIERRGIAFCLPQHKFNLTQALNKSKKYSSFANFQQSPNLLHRAIDDLLNADTL